MSLYSYCYLLFIEKYLCVTGHVFNPQKSELHSLFSFAPQPTLIFHLYSGRESLGSSWPWLEELVMSRTPRSQNFWGKQDQHFRGKTHGNPKNSPRMSKEIPHATEVGCTDRQRGDIYFIHPSSPPLSMDKDYQVKVPALGQPHHPVFIAVAEEELYSNCSKTLLLFQVVKTGHTLV